MKQKNSSLKMNLIKEHAIAYVSPFLPFLRKPSRNQLKQLTQVDDFQSQLASNKPLSLLRFSDLELTLLYDHLWVHSGLQKKVSPALKTALISNQFLPINEKNLKFLVKQYTKEATKFDFYLNQNRPHESFVLDSLFPDVRVLKSLNVDGLLQQLNSKKVFIVSNQFKTIETLSAAVDITPIKTNMKHIRLLNTEVEKVDDDIWFDKLDKLKVEIMKHDFQLLILDAGLFNTHLALFAKSMSKQSIVISLHTLFNVEDHH